MNRNILEYNKLKNVTTNIGMGYTDQLSVCISKDLPKQNIRHYNEPTQKCQKLQFLTRPLEAGSKTSQSP